MLIPGLLQTPDYARVVIEAYRDDARVKEVLFDARMRRQAILQGERHPRLDVILDEAAIRRSVGGESIMDEQLKHLFQAAQRPDVCIQLIPFSSGMHVGTLNGFIILEFDQPIPAVPEADIAGVVYTETLMSGVYYDQPPEVERHVRAFAELRKSALDQQHSAQLLRAAARL